MSAIYAGSGGYYGKIVANGVEFTLDDDMMLIDGVAYKKINGTDGDDTFAPSSGKEVFVANGGDDYVGSVGYSYMADDRIKLLGNRADVSYTRDYNDLIITYNGGTFTISDYYSVGLDSSDMKIVTDDDNEGFSIADDIASKGITVTGTDTFEPTEVTETFIVEGGYGNSAGYYYYCGEGY
ncbi:MAG: hypothetical protein IKP67_05340, partial [Spirochaetales bacterium]|nr:hypothetical protein [Spirochaetales bacterium]